MKKTAINIFAFAFVLLFVAANANIIKAAPRLTLNSTSGTYVNGATFTVSIGVNSETDKSSAVDVFATFDPAKLEIIEIKKSTNPPYSYSMTPIIDNIGGKFNFACPADSQNPFDDKAINGELAVITFKAKEVGTANLNFVCVNGITSDSNIFSSDNDVISCAANNVGSYIITAAAGITSAITPTPTTASTVTATPTTAQNTDAATTTTPTTATTSTELPQTGGIASTVGLIIFGAISVLSALFLKFL